MTDSITIREKLSMSEDLCLSPTFKKSSPTTLSQRRTSGSVTPRPRVMMIREFSHFRYGVPVEATIL